MFIEERLKRDWIETKTKIIIAFVSSRNRDVLSLSSSSIEEKLYLTEHSRKLRQKINVRKFVMNTNSALRDAREKSLGMRVISSDVFRSKNQKEPPRKSYNKVIKLRFFTCYHHSKLHQKFFLLFCFLVLFFPSLIEKKKESFIH